MRKQFLKIFFAVLLLALIINNVDIRQFLFGIKLQDKNFLLFAFFSIPVFIFIRFLKWKTILQIHTEGLSFFQIIRSLLAGMAIGMMTPGKVGELSRAFFVPTDNKERVVGMVLLDRYFDLVTLVFLSSFGVTHYWGVFWGIMAVVVGISGLFVLIWLKHITKKDINSKKFHFVASRMLDMIKVVAAVDFSLFMRLSAFSLGIISISILTSYFLLLSFISIPFKIALNVFPLVILTNTVPLTFGNLGVREGATILLLTHYGVNEEISLNISLSLFALHTVIPSLIGIVLMQFKIDNQGKGRRQVYES